MIDNAVKFSPNGGEIVIAARVEDDQMRVSIQDPGVGIPPDQMYHIFDRYHHLEAVGDHLFGGVGLGLPIAKQVVEQHGGNISVISSPGEGSTFTIIIPVERKNGTGVSTSRGEGNLAPTAFYPRKTAFNSSRSRLTICSRTLATSASVNVRSD